MWRCGCGSPQPDSKAQCHACGTSKGTGSTSQVFRAPQEAHVPTPSTSKPKRNVSVSVWPKITDLESAQGAARQGFWAAIIAAVVTVVVVVLVQAGVQVFDVSINALEVSIDAALFLIVAWGIHKMSRTAAVCGLVFNILSWWSQEPAGLVWAAIFMVLYINGIRGTFRYHKMINSRVNVRNIFILNGLGLLYSFWVFWMAYMVLGFAEELGVDVEAMNDTLVGSVILSGILIVYVWTLMGRMPLGKARKMVEVGVGDSSV
jgi:hypothetical protein